MSSNDDFDSLEDVEEASHQGRMETGGNRASKHAALLNAPPGLEGDKEYVDGHDEEEEEGEEEEEEEDGGMEEEMPRLIGTVQPTITGFDGTLVDNDRRQQEIATEDNSQACGEQPFPLRFSPN